ncbi:heat shock 70 kDa protein 12A-like [Mya arenaria]|uniref:heat shock 70 kDa protein 12A-like n=1 Tax=Mya arenaria TaxID=6604 RepID=UPI0022E1C4A3|nr:heat shock 70 kDa protein 12A-like [Mya arenaria]
MNALKKVFGKGPQKKPSGDGAKNDILLVAAIDFGTTFSGWSFSFRDVFKSEPTRVSTKYWHGNQHISLKAPSSVLIKPDGQTFSAFGYQADTKYNELVEKNEHNEWYYFTRFKMQLYKQKVKRTTEIKDAGGKPLPAMTVVTSLIKFLKDDLLKDIQTQTSMIMSPKDVNWVLTVPAIWDDDAKHFMRVAAEQAGILAEYLTLALEPEAASIFCRLLPVEQSGGEYSLSTFTGGTKFLVVDAGGGTVDIAVQQVTETGLIKNIHVASGGDWGGSKVDEEFFKFITNIIGDKAFEVFKNTCREDFTFLTGDFEIKKRTVTLSTDTVVFRLSSSLSSTVLECTGKTLQTLIEESIYAGKVKLIADKLKVDTDIMKDLFVPQIRAITDHIAKLIEQKFNGLDAIVLVGGFSTCRLLQNAVIEKFRHCRVIIPNESDLVVLKGAVLFGHRPDQITQRISKYTYGVSTNLPFDDKIHPRHLKKIDEQGKAICPTCFCKHIVSGQTLVAGEPQSSKWYSPISSASRTITFPIYRTLSTNPVFVTEEGCQLAGKLRLPLAGSGLDRNVKVEMIYGETEIKVEAKEIATGKVHHLRVDFLN